jgi:hypothetical protein
MLCAVSGFKGASVVASDGWVGTFKDFLFDDETWRIRWMVVDTGTWLPGRKVLIHPSVIAPPDIAARRGLPMMSGDQPLSLSVRLTRRQIEASPSIREDESVSYQIEARVYEYYGWDPAWGTSYFGVIAIAEPLSQPPKVADAPGGNPHLHNIAAVNHYRVHATDGDIGHVANLMADDINWDIRYLVIATSNWWPGKHVLLAPYAVQEIDWPQRHIRLNVIRDKVKSSPPWDPIAMIDKMSEQQLHGHYGWPGYGW